MPRYTEEFKKERTFFIKLSTGYITFNMKCKKCKRNCKQSYKAVLIACPIYKNGNEKLGHGNITTTEKNYAHFEDKRS
jgi:hypothetical protein